jgi:hypothetical protein
MEAQTATSAGAGSRSIATPVVAVLFGSVFGFMLSWGQFTSPDRIRDMLLLEDLYLYEMMFTAIVIGFIGIRLLRRFHARALIGGDLVGWVTERPARHHLGGAFLFGLGWAVTDACPAPIAGQLAQGVWWSVATMAGVFVGIELYLRRQEREAESMEPERRSVSAEPAPAAAARS